MFVVPDTAVISLGVVTERPKAAEASTENAKAVQAVLDVLKGEGIVGDAVMTTAVGLSGVYDSPAKGAPKLTGFRASNNLQIRVKPVDNAGPLAGKLIDKGVNSIDGIEFVSSADPHREDALRGEAMRDARHKAQVYAEALGLNLGPVLAIVPADAQPELQAHAFRRSKMAGSMAASVPLAAGAQEERAAVSVTFELLR